MNYRKYQPEVKTESKNRKWIGRTNKRIAKFTFFYLIPRGYELFYHFRVANEKPCPSQRSTNQNFLFHATAESSLLVSGFFAGFWIWNSKTFEQFRRKKYMKYSPKAWGFISHSVIIILLLQSMEAPNYYYLP